MPTHWRTSTTECSDTYVARRSSKPRRVLSLKPKSRPVAKSKLELEVMAAKAAQMYAKSTAGAIEEIDLASSAPPSYADLRPASTSPVVPRAHAPRKRSSTVSGPDSGADACLPPPHSIAAAAAPPSALAEAGSSAPATRATTTLSEFRNSSNSSSMPSFAGRERSASVASIAEHSSHTALTIPVPARGSGSSIMKMMSRRSSEVSTGAIAYTRSAPSVSSPLAYAKPQPEVRRLRSIDQYLDISIDLSVTRLCYLAERRRAYHDQPLELCTS